MGFSGQALCVMRAPGEELFGASYPLGKAFPRLRGEGVLAEPGLGGPWAFGE